MDYHCVYHSLIHFTQPYVDGIWKDLKQVVDSKSVVVSWINGQIDEKFTARVHYVNMFCLYSINIYHYIIKKYPKQIYP